MAGVPAGLPAGVRVSGHISLGVIARTFPPDRVQQVLAETGKASERERDLPAQIIMYYVIAMALYMGSSTREVLRCLLEGLRWLGAPMRSSSRARAASRRRPAAWASCRCASSTNRSCSPSRCAPPRERDIKGVAGEPGRVQPGWGRADHAHGLQRCYPDRKVNTIGARRPRKRHPARPPGWQRGTPPRP